MRSDCDAFAPLDKADLPQNAAVPRPSPARGLIRVSVAWSRIRRLALLIAALPLLQTTGCFPDLLGALNYELQMLVNSTLLNAVNIIIRNLLGL